MERGKKSIGTRSEERRRRTRRKRSRGSTQSSTMSAAQLDIEGVTAVLIPPEFQKKFGIEIGETITPDMPWMQISKDTIVRDVELAGENSCFYPLFDDLQAFQETELFLGYEPEGDIPDLFYVTTREIGKETVLEIIRHIEDEHKRRLVDSIWRTIGHWYSLGSEDEIVGMRVTNNRTMLQQEAIVKFEPSEEPEFDDIKPKDLKSGYVKLSNTGMNQEDFRNIVRLRYNDSIQVTPVQDTHDAQTEVSYPINMGSQYLYTVDTDTPLEEGPLAHNLANYLNLHVDEIEKILVYNDGMDILTDDFKGVVLHKKDTRTPAVVVYKELESFIHVESSKGMVITAVDWHPTLTGIAACAYVEDIRILPKKYTKKIKKEDMGQEKDSVLSDIYTKNCVLLWCFTDRFKPKLYLESPRPVHSLQFCPYDENILIGGLVNGQIVLWDLKDRIKIVEEKEKLTPAQENYRTAMRNHLKWMNSTKDLAKVNPTAVSSVEFSHQKCITSIHWLTPYWTLTSTGHFPKVATDPDPQNMPMQFLTCSEDGSVDVWDLKVTQPVKAGSYQPRKKWKIRKRPPGLEKSEYQPLHRFIRPHFRIVLEEPVVEGEEDPLLKEDVDTSPVNIPISAMSYDKCPVTQLPEELTIESSDMTITALEISELAEEGDDISDRGDEERGDIDDKITAHLGINEERKKFSVSPDIVEEKPSHTINVGSVDGRVFKLHWQGLVGNLNEVVNFEISEILGVSESLHDGPIIIVQPSPFVNELILTIGGKVFAIWRDDVRGVPMFWKRAPVNIYTGSWSAHRPSMIVLVRGDGILEAWDLSVYSHKPMFQQPLSGRQMTCLIYPSLPFITQVLGIGDNNGALRVYQVPEEHCESRELQHMEEIQMLEIMFDKEKDKKESFKAWGAEWTSQKRKSTSGTKAVSQETEEQTQGDLTNAFEILDKYGNYDEEYEQLMENPCRAELELVQRNEQRWRAERESYMKNTILHQLQWDKAAIMEAEEPLRLQREQEKAKQWKLADRMRKKYSMFERIVAGLFPEMEEKIVREEKTHQKYLEELDALKPRFLREHEKAERSILHYIETHPYTRGFDWIFLVHEGDQRRKILDVELYKIIEELAETPSVIKIHPVLKHKVADEREDEKETKRSITWTEGEWEGEGSEWETGEGRQEAVAALDEIMKSL